MSRSVADTTPEIGVSSLPPALALAATGASSTAITWTVACATLLTAASPLARSLGVPLDRVHAYMWLSVAAARGQPDAEKNQQLVAKAMTPAEIAEAQKLVVEWKPAAAH